MFPLIAAIFLGFISIIWSSKNILNVLIKMMYIVMTLWALFETLKAFGFIVKV